MSQKRLLILVTAGAGLLLWVCTPIVPIVHHIAMHAIAAIAPAKPFSGPHTFALRINGTPVYGVADGEDLWFAVVPCGVEVGLGNKMSYHSQSTARRMHPFLSIITDYDNALELDGVPVKTPPASNVFAIDRNGETHPIDMDTSTIADMVRAGSSRSSIPATISLGADSDFSRVVAAVLVAQ